MCWENLQPVFHFFGAVALTTHRSLPVEGSTAGLRLPVFAYEESGPFCRRHFIFWHFAVVLSAGQQLCATSAEAHRDRTLRTLLSESIQSYQKCHGPLQQSTTRRGDSHTERRTESNYRHPSGHWFVLLGCKNGNVAKPSHLSVRQQGWRHAKICQPHISGEKNIC